MRVGEGDLVRYVPLDPDDGEDACDGGDDLGVGVVREGASFGWLVDFADTVGLLWCAEEELELAAEPGERAPAGAPVDTLMAGPAAGTLSG